MLVKKKAGQARRSQKQKLKAIVKCGCRNGQKKKDYTTNEGMNGDDVSNDDGDLVYVPEGW